MSKPQDCKSIFFEADSTNWRASDKRMDSHDVEFIRADLFYNFVTVRHAFERAYGPLPEGATCHIGIDYGYEGVAFFPTISVNSVTLANFGGSVFDRTSIADTAGPDISDRPASAFVGFFGEDYDKAVRDLEAGE